MADMLQAGSAWLSGQQRSYCSTPVEYRRGVDSHTVEAVLGQTNYDVVDEYGGRVGAQVADFLVRAEAFPFDTPQPGDQIVYDGVVYEVMDLAGQGHWRWSDPDRTMLRIHTREVTAT